MLGFSLLFVLACGLPTASTPPTVVPTLEATSTPIPIPALSIEQIKNAQYQLGTRDDHPVIQLADGNYQRGSDTASADYVRVAMPDFIAMGDLTGDGMDDAVAMVFESYGGTGDFGFLTVFANVDGQPVFLTSTLIDDRPLINTISIENGEIVLDAVIHGINDPMCCAALPTTRRLALVNNQLFMTHFTTNTPDGKTREITITSPTNGSEASGNVQVTGTTAIAPFENSLSYTIQDAVGNQYGTGPIMVTAPDLGAPGTFDATISLDGIPSGTMVYIEIQDLSAADGSLLALDTVKLTVK